MKRILALLMIMAFICTSFSLPVTADNEKELYVIETEIMKNLGIMQIPDGESTLSKTVTRGEFATYIANLKGLTPDEDAKVYFLDVPKGNPYCGVLASLYENNIISGGNNGNFEPDRPIGYDEAYKMLVEICGYGELAAIKGGFPKGYISVAIEFDLLSDSIKSDTFTVSECAKVLFDASIATLHKKTYSSNSTKYHPTSETLLSIYRDVYTCQGTIQGVFGASVVNSNDVKEGRIIIDGNVFETDGQAKEFEDTAYLALEVRGLYKKESDDVNKIFYIWEYGENESVTINSEDFYEYKDYAISYYNKNENLRTANVSKGAVYIFNGVRIDENTDKLYENIENGSITLRKTENSKDFDVVIIKSYENFVVGVYAKDTNKLVEKDNPINSIDLNNYEFIKYFENGLAVETLNYAQKDVLTVSKCGSSIEIHKNTARYTGTVKSLSFGTKYVVVTIDDNEYEVDSKCYAQQEAKLKTGAKCEVRTDIFGRIAYIEFDLSSDWIFAYAFRVAYDEEGSFGDGENIIELYNQNKEFVKLSFAEKIIFDEEKRDGTEDVSGYFSKKDKNGQIEMQMIRYKLNADGEIREIDTIGSGDNSLKACGDGNTSKKIYAPALSMFYDGANSQIAVNDKTIVMEVPYIGTSYDDIRDNKQIYFDVYEINKIPAFTQTTVAGYSVGEEDFASIIIRTEETMELQDRVNEGVIFKSIGYSVSANGDEYKTIYGYSFTGEKVTYLIDGDAEILNMNSLDELSESDVVGLRTYAVGGEKYARVVQKVYDNEDPNYEMPGKEQGWQGFIKDRMAWHHLRPDYSNFILGNVVSIKDNILHLSTHKGGAAVQMYDTSKAPIVIYDKNAPKTKFYIGSLADIEDDKNFSHGGARVIIRKQEITPVGILVYK